MLEQCGFEPRGSSYVRFFDTYTTYVYDQRLVESVDAKSMDMRANLGKCGQPECMWILVSMVSPGTGHLQMPRDEIYVI